MKIEEILTTADNMRTSLQEIRDATAACFRVISMFECGADFLDAELMHAQVKPGFGKRAQEAIAAYTKARHD